MDLVEQIMDYELGELSDEDTIELFSMLVKSGMVWSLQGSYGRTVTAMIAAGVLNEAGEIDYEQLAVVMERE